MLCQWQCEFFLVLSSSVGLHLPHLTLLRGSPPPLPPSSMTQCASHAFSQCVTEWICGRGKTPPTLSLLHLSLKTIHCTEPNCGQEDFCWWDGCWAKAVQGSVDHLLTHLSCVFVQILELSISGFWFLLISRKVYGHFNFDFWCKLSRFCFIY